MLRPTARIFPIGTVLEGETPDYNPNNFYIDGVWEQTQKGMVSVGLDTNQTEFNIIGKTGGAKTHRHILPIGTTNWGDNIGYNASFSDDIINVGTVGWVRQVNTSYLTNVGDYMKFKSDNQTLMQPYKTVYKWKLISYSN